MMRHYTKAFELVKSFHQYCQANLEMSYS
jgi:hypothetical protein